jgi:hypothetical protein
MNAPAPTDTTATTAPLALWRVAEAFMHILHALFGSPAQVAARHTLRFEAHKLMASWLRAGEAMMRRLLLIEAAAFAKPNTRPLLRPSRKRTRKLMSFTADAPKQWRASFRCFVSEDRRLPAGKHRCRQDAGGPRKRISREDRWCSENWKPVRFRSAWPLAERYEALLRVFNNPAPYARRLSRRLHATPHRASALLRAPPEARHRVDHFDMLTQAAETASAAFNSS